MFFVCGGHLFGRWISSVYHLHWRYIRRVWLFNGFLESPVDSHSIAEVVIGDSSDDYSVAEAAGWIRDFAEMD